MTKRFRAIERITRQSLPVLVIAGIGELIAGILLKNYLNTEYFLPGVFVLLPALMNLRGAVSSMFAARLGSAYHLGLMRRGKLFNRTVMEGLKGSLVLALLSSVSAAFCAYFFYSLVFETEPMPLEFFIYLAVLSSVLSAIVLGVFTVFVTRYSIKRKLDPDNITIPIITTAGDILLVFLVYALMVCLKVVC